MDEKEKDLFTIVIADDDFELGALIKRKLTRAGFSVEQTLHASETIEKCSSLSDNTTLLLLDYQLGDMTARDVIIELKKQGHHFPFVVMTGFGDEQVAVEMMKLGADDYLIKNNQFLDLVVPVILQMLERKRIQLSLAQTQKALDVAHQAIMTAENGIFIAEVHDTNCPIVYYNPAFEYITGYNCSAHPTLREWIDSYDLQNQMELDKLYQAVRAHRSIHVQLHRDHNHPTNCHQVSLTYTQKSPQTDGTFIGMIADTTEKYLNERKINRLREQLEQAQRQAIAGEISKELAHEIGHPLTLISSNIQFMLSENEGDQNSLSSILQHIDRITNLLRRFSNKNQESLSPALVSINSLVQPVLNICPGHEKVSVVIDIPQDIPEVFVDQSQIIQILINLLTNALEACKDSGKITFSAGTQKNPDNHKQYAVISVTDTGCGIDPENLQKVFEPFFSTKSKSRNRGLGLSICQNIAHRHQGWLEAHNLQKGACFTLMLPLEPFETNPIGSPESYDRENTQIG